eukprot:scaffold12586_cov132-Isochrysis_galbana.AAC.1
MGVVMYRGSLAAAAILGGTARKRRTRPAPRAALGSRTLRERESSPVINNSRYAIPVPEGTPSSGPGARRAALSVKENGILFIRDVALIIACVVR